MDVLTAYRFVAYPLPRSTAALIGGFDIFRNS